MIIAVKRKATSARAVASSTTVPIEADKSPAPSVSQTLPSNPAASSSLLAVGSSSSSDSDSSSSTGSSSGGVVAGVTDTLLRRKALKAVKRAEKDRVLQLLAEDYVAEVSDEDCIPIVKRGIDDDTQDLSGSSDSSSSSSSSVGSGGGADAADKQRRKRAKTGSLSPGANAEEIVAGMMLGARERISRGNHECDGQNSSTRVYAYIPSYSLSSSSLSLFRSPHLLHYVPIVQEKVMFRRWEAVHRSRWSSSRSSRSDSSGWATPRGKEPFESGSGTCCAASGSTSSASWS